MTQNDNAHKSISKKPQALPSRKGVLWVVFAAVSMAAGVISFVPCMLMAAMGYGLNGTVWSGFLAMVIAMVPVGCFVNAGSSLSISRRMFSGIEVSRKRYIFFGVSAVAPVVVLAVFILLAMF